MLFKVISRTPLSSGFYSSARNAELTRQCKNISELKRRKLTYNLVKFDLVERSTRVLRRAPSSSSHLNFSAINLLYMYRSMTRFLEFQSAKNQRSIRLSHRKKKQVLSHETFKLFLRISKI